MKKNNFGEHAQGYSIPVFNEREVRAAAGILFLGAGISFAQAFLNQNFTYLKIFLVFFFIDFVIRLFINTRYSPTLVAGRMMVSNQKPEYTGAPQKKFAWYLGFGMSATMLVLVFLLGVSGPITLLFCVTCLSFFFFEVAFGICVGCKMYEWFTKEKPQLCPGAVCEIQIKEPIQEVSLLQKIILFVFIVLVVLVLCLF